MLRRAAPSLAAGLIAAGMVSCAPTGAPPPGMASDGPANTESPIAGATLRCAQDYPDSVLVFAPDGTISGRYAGEEVSGQWDALAPDRVEVLVQAGGIAVRDTMRRTPSGWRGENTACG